MIIIIIIIIIKNKNKNLSTQYFINLNPLTYIYIKIITQRINQGVGSDTTC